MIKILKKSFAEWYHKDPFTYSAAIAYYTVFSLPAFLLIFITIISAVLDKEWIEGQTINYLSTVVGSEGAERVYIVVENFAQFGGSFSALLIGIIILILISLRLFLQLQKALNVIWGVKRDSFSITTILKRRLFSLIVIMLVTAILFLSLFISSVLPFIENWLISTLSNKIYFSFYYLKLGVSLLTTLCLFTIILKILPDRKTYWKYSFIGATVTTILFVLGEYGLNFYFNYINPSSLYGVAGTLIVLMLWVWYSSLILLYGAQFSRSYYLNSQKS